MGEEAMEVVIAGAFDPAVMLLDYTLPEMGRRRGDAPPRRHSRGTACLS